MDAVKGICELCQIKPATQIKDCHEPDEHGTVTLAYRMRVCDDCAFLIEEGHFNE